MNSDLLGLLADAAFHSGSELATQLGVSRTTVWKQIQALEALGVDIHSVRGRGYRLPQGLDLLDQEKLKALLDAAGLAGTFQKIQIDLETDSTNLGAQRAIAAGYAKSLFAAEYQHGGRGRRGRSWISPFAANLYFSLSWPFSGGISALEGLSLAVGVSLRGALDSLGVGGVALKWPNDLLLEQRKLGGVLIEIGGDLSGDCRAVIGIGLNVRMSALADRQIDQPWNDLTGLLPDRISRTELLALLVQRLVAMLTEFQERGFSHFRDEWEQANAFADRPVRIELGKNSFTGLCLGVDQSGALRIGTADGERLVQGGEVSLRGVA